MDRLIYVECDYDGLYGKFWGQLGEVRSGRELFLNHPEEYALVCFTGGSDVSPELYGHQNLGSHNDEARDAREMEIFQTAHKAGIPMTGICRGSQFLNVMMGGTMVQHLKESHGGGSHTALVRMEGRKGSYGLRFEVTSSHHQMSVLGAGGTLLSWAEQTLMPQDMVYDGGVEALDPALESAGNLQTGIPMKHTVSKITEAFAYPAANIFAVQHHPEWQNVDCPAARWTLEMIRQICFGETEEVLSI